MGSTRRLLALKRFILGLASGGAYPVAKSFEKDVRIAERDERRDAERHGNADGT